MSNHIAAKNPTIRVCAAVLSLLLLTLSSCDATIGSIPPARIATRHAEERIATHEVETAIAGQATYEARATSEAEATEAAAQATSEAEAAEAAATVAAEVTHTSEERASTEPALEITKMATKVLTDNPKGVADIDYIFTVKYATAGHTAFLVCYEENVESERTPVSAESGTAEVIVHLVNFDYYGAGQYEPFCELRAASSDEVLAEAHPGPDTVYGD